MLWALSNKAGMVTSTQPSCRNHLLRLQCAFLSGCPGLQYKPSTGSRTLTAAALGDYQGPAWSLLAQSYTHDPDCITTFKKRSVTEGVDNRSQERRRCLKSQSRWLRSNP